MKDQLLARYPLISDQVEKAEVAIILRELATAIEQSDEGAVVEFGCYVGTTSLFIRRLLDGGGERRDFHVYDSFVGLPDKSEPDISPVGEQFRVGELSVSKQDFIKQFKKAGLKVPVIHKGWFADLTDSDVPDKVAFAFLDGDYYESILTSLGLLWPRLVPGAIIIVDDYMNEALPGVRKAIDEWMKVHPARVRTEASLALLYPNT